MSANDNVVDDLNSLIADLERPSSPPASETQPPPAPFPAAQPAPPASGGSPGEVNSIPPAEEPSFPSVADAANPFSTPPTDVSGASAAQPAAEPFTPVQPDAAATVEPFPSPPAPAIPENGPPAPGPSPFSGPPDVSPDTTFTSSSAPGGMTVPQPDIPAADPFAPPPVSPDGVTGPVEAQPAPTQENSPFTPPDPAVTPEHTNDLPFAAPTPSPESSLSPDPLAATPETSGDTPFVAPDAPTSDPEAAGDTPFAASPKPAEAQSFETEATSTPGVASPESSPYVSDIPTASSPETASPANLTPKDILYSIAEDSGDSGTAHTSVLQNIRSEAKESVQPKSKLQKMQSKVKFDSLPFESILPGNPLIVACYSPSGGAGKSSTAMNLGIYMATVAQKMAEAKGPDARVPRVLTLDGDIITGSLSLRLTGKVKPNIYDLQRYIDERLDAGLDYESAWPSSFDVEKPGEKPMYKFTHWPENPSNFSVLASPDDPSAFWRLASKDYKQILKMLGRFYDVIIIDCGTDIVLETQRSWLSHAHEVFLLTTPDSDRLFNSAKVARLISTPKPHPQDHRKDNAQKLPPLAPAKRVSLLVTRADIDSGLPLEESIDKLFKWLKGKDDRKFWMKDVYYEMMRANNSGRFLVKENQEYANVIGQLAKRAFASYVDNRQAHSLPSAES